MIRIKPDLEIGIFCPKCFQKAVVKESVIKSAFALADCVCENCNFEFFQTLPVSHTIVDTLTIDKVDGTLYPDDVRKTWLSKALLRVCQNEVQAEIQIEKIIYKKYNHVVVLNTLDYLYGHVLLKLYNSIHHLDSQKELGLILIIPKSLEWLLPQGCAEAWIVDLDLNALSDNRASIQEFVSREFERFDTIYLSKAYSHPDFTTIDISRLTGIAPFDLTNFAQERPRFTFVLREDRWWLNGLFDYWFYRLCRWLGVLKMGSAVLAQRQNDLVKETILLVMKKIPGANFHIVGLGLTGNFKGYAHDERVQVPDPSSEKEWCKIYSRSHVVIGVHGSNMLLPTAHAAGCVEILPEDRLGNIVQDISVRYNDRRQLYFYRFADQYARPEVIADKLISIVKDFEIFEKNMCRNVYSAEEPSLISSL